MRGIPTIDINRAPPRKGYAAHTLNCVATAVPSAFRCAAWLVP